MEAKTTFQDLENLIESNIGELQEQQITFTNKADALQQQYFASTAMNEKLSLMQNNLNVLYLINDQVEREIKNTNAVILEMEERVHHLENCAQPMCVQYPILNSREKLYGLTEQIDAYINNCKEEVELVQTESLQAAKTNGQDTTIENIARIMMNLLEGLETVELSVEKMKSHIHCINWKNKILEERLSLNRK